MLKRIKNSIIKRTKRISTNQFVKSLEKKGAVIGQNPEFIGSFPLLKFNGKVVIGDKFKTRSIQFKISISVGKNGQLILGDNVFLNQGSNIYAAKKVVFGDHSGLSDLACVFDTNFHGADEGEETKESPVILGKHVWVGRAAIILPGVTIGDYSVVGAGSVVVSPVPPRVIVAGNPAKVVRELHCSDGWIRR